MIKEYTIENFKAFAGPTTVPIKPITLKFGPNSSGKSSIFQSLLMLKQTIEEDIGLESTLLTKGNLVDLGSYREFIYNHDAQRSFSFKINLRVPKKIEELFASNEFVLRDYNDFSERLVRSVDFDTMGLKMIFSLREKAGIIVDKIDLFLGNDLAPVMSFANENPDRTFAEKVEYARKTSQKMWEKRLDQEREFKFGIVDNLRLVHTNPEHNYWKKYCSEFYSEDSHYTLYLLNALNDKSGDAFPEILMDFENNPVTKSLDLWKHFQDKQYDRLLKVSSDSHIKFLNKLLEIPYLYNFLLEKREKFSSAWKSPYPGFDRLQKITREYRVMPFEKLTKEQKAHIKQFNVLVLHTLLSINATDLFNHLDEELVHLNHFLPESGIMGKPQDIMHLLDPHGKNVSIFAFSAAEKIKIFLQNLQYIGPFRPFPDRYYMFSGSTTGFVGSAGKYVLDILVPENNFRKEVNKNLSSLGLDYELIISEISSKDEGLNGSLTLRLCKKSSGVITGLADVGFGVSQVLPIVTQSVVSKDKTILIEQPELHLHPAQQAELGDIFIESALGENKNTFLIETHSEHLILRFLRRIRETASGELEDEAYVLRPEDIAVIYAKPTSEGTKLIELRVSDEGDFIDKWPDGFFAERAKELF